VTVASVASQRTSHRRLLTPLRDEGPLRPVDAIVVPASRSAEHLRSAAAIAHKTDSELLVLCSREARPASVERVLVEECVSRFHVVDVPADHTCDLLPPLRPPTGLTALASRPELSRKRNLALLVARLVGWRTALFLDDDITLDVADVVAAQHGLDTATAVGFPVEEWPDNSVVGHANRASGGNQDVFVGPSALLVDTESELLGHFPTIYNEGALFLFDAVAARRVSRSSRPAAQLPYNPFQDFHRGRDEEFGDVIVEGLMSALYEQAQTLATGAAYWRWFLTQRRAFLKEVTERLLDGPASPQRRSALGAVRSAERQHALITPSTCARFVRHWRAERRLWVRQLAELERVPSIPAALERLGVPLSSPRPRPFAVASCIRRSTVVAPPLTAINPRVKAASNSDTLAVLIPGFLDSESWAGTRRLAEDLHRSGRTAVSFDPRGTFRTPGTADQIRPTLQICDAISAIGMVRPHARTVLIGHSLGASIAVFAAAQDPRVTDIVAIMPPRCFVWPYDYDADRDTWRRDGHRRFVVATSGSSVRWNFTVPHSVVEDARQHDLPATLRALRDDQRILFIAGRDDTVIPTWAVERLFGECGSRNKLLAVLPVGHDYRDHPDQLRRVNRTVLEWLDAPAAVGWRRAPAAAPAPEWSAAACHPA
jgi:pimeloyl-ACP methyl ester carboxylesterase